VRGNKKEGKMFENVTRQLAESVIETSYSSLPQEVIEKIKLMLLDSIGCALGGYITDRARIALELAEEFGGNPQASIIGNRRTSYALATFANSELINSLDYDYIGPLTSHVAPYVTPPSLAIAEREHSSGKDLILALALAHEVGGRMVSALAQHKVLKEEPPYYEESPRFSTTSEVFGSVAGAGKLLDLDMEEMTNAFGIAGASTAVPANIKWEHMSGPSIMAKYNCWAGWISQLAVVAALAAEKGFTGDRTILDGELGFWKIVGSPFFKVDNLLEGLGEVWHIGEVRFKMYPTCFVYHTAIEGISKIMQEHEIKPETIDEIVVKGDPIIQTENRLGTEMVSFADTQFSNTFNIAIAAFYGNSPSPAWQLPATFNDPRIKALMQKVKFESHPRIDEFITGLAKAGKLPIFMGSIVEITTKGRKFTEEVLAPKGSQDNPATEAELIEKFRNNACYSTIKSAKVQDIIEMINHLEEIDDVSKLFALLTL